MLDGTLSEKDFADAACKHLTGFVSGRNTTKDSVKFYDYRINQFTIGNINLGEQNIWITFDDRIKDNVLGLDLLQKICLLQFNDTQELLFFKDKQELLEYVRNIT